jgi:type IV secretory pathway VirD2 relaxase
MSDLIRNDLDMRPRSPYRRGEKHLRNRAWWKALVQKSGRTAIPSRSNTRLERRGSSAIRAPHSFMQRSVVKASYTRNTRVTSWAAHGRYLAREGAQREGEKGLGFDSAHGDIDLSKTLAGWQKEGDQHMFRWIVSPENAASLDLPTHARELMDAVQRDLATRLEWVAIDHHDTDNPHIHILVRGLDERGQVLRIDRDYIKSGIRARSSESASKVLGLLTENDRVASRGRVVSRDQFTEIDRSLLSRADERKIVTIGSKASSDPNRNQPRAQDLARLRFLERNGLAE